MEGAVVITGRGVRAPMYVLVVGTRPRTCGVLKDLARLRSDSASIGGESI